jgi:hypothetical protein
MGSLIGGGAGSEGILNSMSEALSGCMPLRCLIDDGGSCHFRIAHLEGSAKGGRRTSLFSMGKPFPQIPTEAWDR